MRTCIIHMGLHKTASTSLQRMLCLNRDVLLKANIYFPETGTEDFRFGHHTLSAELNGTARQHKPLYRSLLAELKEQGLPDKILLSSEDFSRRVHDPAFLARFAGQFARLGYRLEMTAYVRPQHTAIQALYTQRLKMWAAHQDFNEFWRPIVRGIAYDYNRRFDALLRSQTIAARFFPFNSEIFAQGIHQHFLSSLGVPQAELADLDIPSDRNITPGPKTIAALIEIEELLRAKGLVVARREADWTVRIIRRMANARGWDDQRYNALTPQINDAIQRRFRRSNRLFARRAFRRRWEDVFAAELASTPPVNVFRRKDATPEEREQFDEFTHSAAEAIVRFRAGGEGLEAAQ